MELDAFTRSYIETALWSSMDNSRDDGGDPLDENYDADNLSPDALASMARDCEAFQRANAADLATGTPERGGHDFWLTRNRHGAGFWDGDWADDVGKRLTDAAHAFGAVDLYVVDGKVHAS